METTQEKVMVKNPPKKGVISFVTDVIVWNLSGGIGYQAVPRDAFPVFDDPPMVTAAEAEESGLVFDRDAVIGVALNGEAKAYPVTVMGVHELGNDSVGGVPIAVS